MRKFVKQPLFLAAVFIALGASTLSGECSSCERPDTIIEGTASMTFWTGCQKECQKRCEFNLECKTWTYNPLSLGDNDCSLFTTEKYVPKVGMISGPKRCGNAYGCMIKGWTMPSAHRIGDVAAKDAMDCRDICRKNPKCGYAWFEAGKGGKCYLMTSDGIKDLMRHPQDPDAQVVPRDCHPEWCFVTGQFHECSGEEAIGHYSGTPSASKCQKLCADHGPCDFWTWNKNGDKRCYMRKFSCHKKNVLADATAVTGLKHCASLRTEKYDYYGQDVEMIPNIGDAEVCWRKCHEHTGCFFFTWDEPRRECLLKGHDAIGYRHSDSKRNSGPVTYDGEYPDCVERDHHYKGSFIQQIEKVKSMQDCAKLCWDTKGCYFFSYGIHNYRCDLKTGSVTSKTRVQNIHSAPVSCYYNPAFKV